MENRLQQNLIPALIDKSVAWHCRKGLRVDCFCSYCQAKREGTWTIGHQSVFPRPYTGYWTDWWEYEPIKRARRQREIDKLRAQLEELRKEII